MTACYIYVLQRLSGLLRMKPIAIANAMYKTCNVLLSMQYSSKSIVIPQMELTQVWETKIVLIS